MLPLGARFTFGISGRSNQAAVSGGCGFGLSLRIAPTKTYPFGRVVRIGGIGGVAKPLDIPSVVAFDDWDITDLRRACAHAVPPARLCAAPHPAPSHNTNTASATAITQSSRRRALTLRLLAGCVVVTE